jgi:hypothetical protein
MSGRVDSTSHAAAIARVNEAIKFAPELREHLEEIFQSAVFRGSQRSQLFLKHIVERSLGGASESLRERLIGMDLFGRPVNYDTGEDAIVRVTASDVRKRLLQYYENANIAPRCRIELPAGTYVPEFRCSSEKETIATVDRPTAHQGDHIGHKVDGDTAAMAPLPPFVEPRLQTQWRRYAVAATLLVLAGVAAGWFLGRRAASRPLPPNDLVSAAFQGASRTIQVIVSDDALVAIQVLLGRRFTLQEYENLSYLNASEWAEDADLQRLRKLLSTQQITNIGDLQNAARFRENLRARDWEVIIRHARQVNARDFRSGNFVLLGGAYSNPWANLFRVQDSNFPLEDSPPPGKPAAYVNRHPLPGEPLSFAVESRPNLKTITHARVTLLENVSHSGRVLLVAGQSVSATELAGEFLFHDESVDKTRRMLGLDANSPLPDLEMMLRVTEMNQVGDSVQLVACRRLIRDSD